MHPQKFAFDNVVIRLTRQIYYDSEAVFWLEVRQSPGPLPGGTFQVNVEARLEQFRQIFDQRVTENQFFYRYEEPVPELGSTQTMADLGRELYDLLPEPFRLALPRLIQRVFEKGRGLRLIIEARAGDKADRLLSLPWELLFYKETQIYLARSPRILIVRRLLDTIRRSPLQLASPLDVTHIIAHTPTAPQAYQIDPYLQQVERETIPQAIAPGRYQLVDSPGSVEQMMTALQEQACYVVHFLGHGEFLEADEVDAPEAYPGRGYLRFVGEDGNTQWVTGEHLQHLLSATPTVQLVVLNACHGGASAAANVALELVYSGLPNVVAIQSDILQEAARYFIEAFYTELQHNTPIEHAVAVGRAAIAANMPQVIDWCLPVLYTSAGLPEQPVIVETGDHLWRWAGHPKSGRWTGVGTIIFGLVHLVVGILLLLSNASPPLPDSSYIGWITGGLVIVPFLLTIGAYLSGQLSLPAHWSSSSRIALILNSLGSASVGIGLSTCYAFFFLMLLASFGFWAFLSPPAQWILLGLIFIPGILLAYSQIVGHGRAFISNAQVKRPTFQGSDLLMPAAGYMLLFLPWVGLKYGSGLLMLPSGNFIVGIFLLVLGYSFYTDKAT